MPWVAALLLTLAVETPLLVMVAPRRQRSSAPTGGRRASTPMATHAIDASTAGWAGAGRVASVAVLVNLVTHPLLWFVVMPALTPIVGWAGALAAAETAVVLAEAAAFVVLLDLDELEALATSVFVNAASVAFGVVAVAAAR